MKSLKEWRRGADLIKARDGKVKLLVWFEVVAVVCCQRQRVERKRERMKWMVWSDLKRSEGVVWSCGLWLYGDWRWFDFFFFLWTGRRLEAVTLKWKPLVPSGILACNFNQSNQLFVQQVDFSLQTEHVTPSLPEVQNSLDSRRFKTNQFFYFIGRVGYYGFLTQ